MELECLWTLGGLLDDYLEAELRWWKGRMDLLTGVFLVGRRRSQGLVGTGGVE